MSLWSLFSMSRMPRCIGPDRSRGPRVTRSGQHETAGFAGTRPSAELIQVYPPGRDLPAGHPVPTGDRPVPIYPPGQDRPAGHPVPTGTPRQRPLAAPPATSCD